MTRAEVLREQAHGFRMLRDNVGRRPFLNPADASEIRRALEITAKELDLMAANLERRAPKTKRQRTGKGFKL